MLCNMSLEKQYENPEGENFCGEKSNPKARIRTLKNRHFLCPQIESLNISFCTLSMIPKIIFSLEHLTELNLSNNYLESLPNEIGNLHNLLVLNLSANNLNTLPVSIKYIHNLNSIDLSSNDFFKVPNVLYCSLGVLKLLDLSFNKINDFDCAPQCINTLRVLKISCNRLISFPKWLFYSVSQLQVLDICGNGILSDLKNLNDLYIAGVFESLQYLNVENCKLSCEKIQFLSNFKNLEVLQMGNQKHRDMEKFQNYMGNFKSAALKSLKTLKSLHLQYVSISSLPLDFDCMKNLEVLDLSGNLLSWLPECFCDLVCLKILNLMSNQLIFLPNNISKLLNLQELHLGNNNLCTIPEGICNLNSLEYVDFYNNKIEEFDFTIFKNKNLKGIDLGLNYLQHLSEFGTEAIKSQYESLKNCLRQHFNYVNYRCDEQILKNSSEDVSCHTHKLPSSNGSDIISDFEDFVVTNTLKPWPDSCKEENWENDIVGVEEEKEDLFNPNEMQCVSRTLDNRTDEWGPEFRDNYCPAYSRVPSFLETYAKNFVESTSKHKTVEGQFDSD